MPNPHSSYLQKSTFVRLTPNAYHIFPEFTKYVGAGNGEKQIDFIQTPG
jgi:hypothetical protein